MNDNQTPLLALEHLAFSYKADAPVFTDASLSLHPGEIIGLWSENGSGKTTLLRLVTGLEVKASGRILLEGRPVETPEDFRALRRRVGFVLQNAENQLFFPEVFDDALARDRLISLLNGLPEAKIVVSHDPGFLKRVCTRLVTIRAGAIEAIEPDALPDGGAPSE